MSNSCNPMDCSLPGSSVHGIPQAKIQEWVSIFFSRGSFWPRDQTHVSCIGRWIIYHQATSEALFHVSYSISFLKIKKNTHPQKPQLLEIMKTWATALNAPLDELPAKNLFGKNLTSYKNKKELGRYIKNYKKKTWGEKANQSSLKTLTRKKNKKHCFRTRTLWPKVLQQMAMWQLGDLSAHTADGRQQDALD